MIPVNPNTRTTLILDGRFIATGRFFTARAALRNLMNGWAKGWDAVGNIVTWDGTDLGNISSPASSVNWQDGTVVYYPDQPCLRSAPNPLTGEERQWAIPTIMVATRFMGASQKRGESISLKTLYKMQKKTCQYCWEKIPFELATKDHIYPKSMGGSNDDFNLVLACQSCNRKKGAITPYYDKNGQIPQPVKRGLYTDIDISIRPEWRTHLHLDDEPVIQLSV